MPTASTRAKPLPPEDRRRTIVEAVIPLLVAEGPAVTTRQMADAAGVAEGTIFSVFPDKPSILAEAIKVSIDPSPLRDALAAIPSTLAMEEQLEMAADLLSKRSERLMALVSVLRTMPHSDFPHHGEAHRHFAESNEVVLTALSELLERHREDLTVDPRRAAVVFRGLVFVNTHPTISPGDRLTSHEIVEIALRGVIHPGHEAGI